MVQQVKSSYSDRQIAVWLRGLLTIAWADGHFDPEEQDLILHLAETELAPETNLKAIEAITPIDLADHLGEGNQTAENFMRMAVMVAIVDGVYSESEDKLLHEFCTTLGVETKILEALRVTLSYCPTDGVAPPYDNNADLHDHHLHLLRPLQEWMDGLEIHDPRLARFLCKLIPPQCPFERDIKLFGHKVVHIPPMCKLNPLYDQLVGLRFRALSYLADDCKEDVSKYC
ncbi:Mo-dependent nitrogenase C-terminal domain-containing protein [Leptolyngbya ohadii]|uniref:Mo-dependent nitrogenase C-terminal domain-containing protein n=1 Tax=Leptolyngbya ohadii TaxID=1962290 RepID=UPI000B59F5C0|nr:Mo-dependent nitrogenase C-terminal domain-containing protein [Leptolyngbya ohadii]